MVMLRTCATNGSRYFLRAINWLDGCLGFEPRVAQSHRLEAFVAGGWKGRAQVFNRILAFALRLRKITVNLIQGKRIQKIHIVCYGNEPNKST